MLHTYFGEEIMLNRLLSWIKAHCFNKHGTDEKISLESLGIKFVLFQKQPKVVAFTSTEYSETRWIAELINSEIQQSKQGAQEMIDRLNSAKKDPTYQWEGTTNSLIVKITNQEVSLLPLYD